jgi:hypothetical protein
MPWPVLLDLTNEGAKRMNPQESGIFALRQAGVPDE